MDKYIKVPIFPVIKYMSAQERQQKPAPMMPISFMYGLDEIHIDSVLACERGVSRKVGGRGFRFTCRVSWRNDDGQHSQQSIVWYDDFLEEWFVEVPESRAPSNWVAATQLDDIRDEL